MQLDIVQSLQALPQQIGGLRREILIFTAIVSLVWALLQCFMGYRLLRTWMTAVGFLIGFCLGVWIGGMFVKDPAYAKFLIGLAAGAAVAILAFKVYLVGVFLYCGALTASVACRVPFPQEGVWPAVRVIAVLTAFAVAGFLAVRFSRVYLIVLTTLTGGLNALKAMALLMPAYLAQQNMRLAVLGTLVGFGLLIQLLTTGNGRRR